MVAMRSRESPYCCGRLLLLGHGRCRHQQLSQLGHLNVSLVCSGSQAVLKHDQQVTVAGQWPQLMLEGLVNGPALGLYAVQMSLCPATTALVLVHNSEVLL